MKFFLSSIGSRGDVQPLLALALELRTLGHHPLLCVAPNFHSWITSFGLACVPLGPDLEAWTRATPSAARPLPTPEQLRQLAHDTVVEQFRVVSTVAQDCDGILVGGMLQTAGRSIAEALGIPYVYAAYCPATLPSPDYPPATMRGHHAHDHSADENRRLWITDADSANGVFRDTLNAQRDGLGLPPVMSVPRHITTDRPWLAADPVLGPAGTPIEMKIWQPGAWSVADSTPLPADIEQFLADGAAPLYFGFGSMRAAADTSAVLIAAARALGRRAILLQGWGNLAAVDAGNDMLVIGDVNHDRLLPQVAAVIHHGGAGTTTAAARAGRPQVIVPHVYDQYYWAQRVATLGIGVAGPLSAALTLEGVVAALRACLEPQIAGRAAALAPQVERHGARYAAERLIRLCRAAPNAA